ncbi:MAG TPA: FAD-dependent oxidoreductase [Pseudonocardiaceae bacterium]|nr:FAD-dependent oxidoreductase [Pseudonocardiaceae bacterium]
MAQQFVIIGAGLAGAKAAQALRDQGYDGDVVLIGDERHRPYERPPLSKDYLAGKAERDSVFVHSPEWYGEHRVELRLGAAATAVDRSARQVTLDGGGTVGYHRLLLATGASPRRLPVPGADAEGVHYLRRIGDSEAIRSTFGGRLVIVGAGWIGLEVAAAARQAGSQVTVIEVAELPLLGVLGPQIATVFADLHRDQGVDLRLSTQLAEITTAGGRATGVRLADGTVIDADAVVIGVGVRPNTDLAEAAGLTTDNGVLADATLRTSDDDVFAAGDVVNAMHPLLGRHIRVEHWANALNQPATAAASMLGGTAPYEELPYFYTDQYDLGMEYVGYVEPGRYSRVAVRGDTGAREFVAFWLDDRNCVLAGMNVNVWDVVDPIKALIRSRRPVDPAALADQQTDLAELATP